MRGLRGHRLAGVVLGLAVGALAAQKPTESSSWWASWWGGNDSKTTAAKAQKGPPAPRPDRTAEQSKLEKAYLRRQAVCDRLREIAQERNDTQLSEEAARLEEIAWKLFQSRSELLLGAETADEGKTQPVIDETREMLLNDAKKKRERGR
ncbi:MAG: hypothetical protein EBV06_06060 [Planctomycetia bacterium]|nr:hypothetical protein [Planctomycetia bacterium]